MLYTAFFFSGCTSGVLLKARRLTTPWLLTWQIWSGWDHPDVAAVDVVVVLLLQQHCEGEMPNWKACDDQHWCYWPVMNLSRSNPIIIFPAYLHSTYVPFGINIRHTHTVGPYAVQKIPNNVLPKRNNPKINGPVSVWATVAKLTFQFIFHFQLLQERQLPLDWPHHQFLDPFLLEFRTALCVCWVIEMGETWWRD